MARAGARDRRGARCRSRIPSLPLVAELRRLDAIAREELLLADLTWIEGRPHVAAGDLQVPVTVATMPRLASEIAAAMRASAA